MRKLSPQSIFSHYAIFSLDYAISNEQTRTETQTKGRRGKGRNKRIRRRCFNLRNDRSLRGRAPRDRVDANNRETL